MENEKMEFRATIIEYYLTNLDATFGIFFNLLPNSSAEDVSRCFKLTLIISDQNILRSNLSKD